MSIQDNLSTFATAIGNAIKPFKYVPAKPAAAGNYELAVDAQGQASWAAPATAGGGAGSSGMEFSAMYRSTDQNIGILEKITFDQFHGGEVVSNAPAGETFESWTSGSGSDIWYTSWGSLFLRANKTYLLRSVLYLNGLNSSYNCRLGWGTHNGDAYLPQYATTPLNSLMTVPVQSTSNQEIMCVVLEQVYRPTTDISISPGIISSSASGGRFNILQGSSAFIQRLA